MYAGADHPAWHRGEHRHLHCTLQLLHSFIKSSRSWRSSFDHLLSAFHCFGWSCDLWRWARKVFPHFRSLLMGLDFCLSTLSVRNIFITYKFTSWLTLSQGKGFVWVWTFSLISFARVQLAFSSELSHKWVKKMYINLFECFQVILKWKQKHKSSCSIRTAFTTKRLFWQTDIFGWKRVIKITLTKFSNFCKTVCDTTQRDCSVLPKQSRTC